jgi:hypothetical protein
MSQDVLIQIKGLFKIFGAKPRTIMPMIEH